MEVTMIPASWRLASSVSSLPMIVPFSSSRWLMGSSRKMKSKGWQRLRIKATLCCWPKDSFPAFSFTLVGNADGFEEGKDFFPFFEIGKPVLQLYVLDGGKFGKDTQLLKKNAERVFAYIYPVIDGE